MDSQNSNEIVQNILDNAVQAKVDIDEVTGLVSDATAASEKCLDRLSATSESLSAGPARHTQEIIDDLKKAAGFDYNRI